MTVRTTQIPDFLLRAKQPRFLVSDDGTLIITQGDQTIPLAPVDIARLRDFVNRFDPETSHAHA